MNSSATLSVCMIVKNEASILGRCLQSIYTVADEIIVVDTGSTDSTIEIAKRYGAQVYIEPWKNDFAAARNVSLQNATSKWILWLDADDVVPQSTLAQLNKLKATSPDKVYGFIVRNERPGNTGTEFVQARMFPNDPQIQFERKIHEQIMPCALRLGLKLEKVDAVIEHHGYAQPAALKVKAKRNLDLLLVEYALHGPDTVTALEIADSYQLIESYDNASIWYQKVLDIKGCRETTPALAGHALLGLGTIANRRENYTDAIRFLDDAHSCSPWRPDVHYSLAVAYELSGDSTNALEQLHKILTLNEQPGQVGVDFRASKIKAYLRLIRLCTELDKLPDAFCAIDQAIAQFPLRPEIHTLSGKVHLKAGKLLDALHAFEKSILLVREGNLDAYIGLCIIYRFAGAHDKVTETLSAMEQMFAAMEKFQVFSTHFIKVSSSELSSHDPQALVQYEQIRREFFFVI